MILNPARKELSKKFNILKTSYIEPFFKKYKFEKQRGEYIRKEANLNWVLNIQKASWDSEEVLSFTINWGLGVPGYWVTLGMSEEKCSNVFLGERIGRLLNGEEVWWKIRLEDDSEDFKRYSLEINNLLTKEIIDQLISGIHDLDEVIAFLKALRDRPQNRVIVCGKEKAMEHLAILYSLKGDKQKSLEILDELISLFRVPHLKDSAVKLREKLARL